MVAIERVICPIDLSSHSGNALRVAAAWARWYDAWLHVLHVAPLPQPVLSPSGLLAALPVRPLPEIRAEVHRFVVDTLGPDHGALIDVLQGHVAGTILHASARPHALLVMGTHGWSGLDRLLLGSVAERVAHSTHCPVLVVPPQAEPKFIGAKPKQMLCAVDFRPSSLAGSRYALSLAQENEGRLELMTVLERRPDSEIRELLHALQPEDESHEVPLRKLRERVPDDARLWCNVQLHVAAGKPADVLLQRADVLGADLIVMGTGDRLHLHGVWLGSTTGRLLRQAHCPVLIVPGPERLVLAGSTPLPVGDWADEFERVTKAHQGQPATIAIIRDDLGAEREASAMPLAGVSLEGQRGHSRVVIMLTKSDGARLTHVIHDPCSIRLGATTDQSGVQMLVTAQDGTATLLGVGMHQS